MRPGRRGHRPPVPPASPSAPPPPPSAGPEPSTGTPTPPPASGWWKFAGLVCVLALGAAMYAAFRPRTPEPVREPDPAVPPTDPRLVFDN